MSEVRDSGARCVRHRQNVVLLALPAICLFESPSAFSDNSIAQQQTHKTEAISEEVIVTAQRRQERLQDVPISISVLGGDELDKSALVGVSEALSTVPGVSVVPSYFGGSQVTVRGVSSTGALFSGASPSAYYLDSIPYGLVKSAVAPDASLYDLDRIEVLRGPQGTLYGASTLSGVVRILTHEPDLDRLDFKVRTSASSIDNGGQGYRVDAALNVPVIEGKLAVRGVMGYGNDDGWIDTADRKDVNDADLRSARLKVNAQPTEDLSLGLSMWRSRSEYGAPSSGATSITSTARLPQPIATDIEIYGFKAEYQLAQFTVSSSTSYLDYTNENYLDFSSLVAGSTQLFTSVASHVFSEELGIQSTANDNWRWSVGGIYRRGSDTAFQRLPPAVILGSTTINTSRSYAVFGEITRLLMDNRWELTVGFRHYEDRDAQRAQSTPTAAFVPAESISKANTPRGVVTWHPNLNTTVYASYSEGFRSGFPQGITATAAGLPPVSPDKLKNYELGSKGTFSNGKFGYDAAVYFMKWNGIQFNIPVRAPNGLLVSGFINGQSASGMGLDFGITSHPLTGMTLGLSLGWNDLQMDEDLRAFPTGGPSTGVVVFDKDERIAYSPEYTAAASMGYEFALGGTGFQGRFSASANYTSRQKTQALIGITRTTGEGNTMLIGRTSFAIDSSKGWTAMLFVDNVGNEGGAPVFVVGGSTDWPVRPRPRTIGLQLDYGF